MRIFVSNVVYKNSKSSVCRSCLRSNRRLNCIYSKYQLHQGLRTLNITIVEMLTSCTQVSIEKEDGLPQFICIPCTKKVAIAYAFRWQTRQSDSVLRNFLEANSNECFKENKENDQVSLESLAIENGIFSKAGEQSNENDDEQSTKINSHTDLKNRISVKYKRQNSIKKKKNSLRKENKVVKKRQLRSSNVDYSKNTITDETVLNSNTSCQISNSSSCENENSDTEEKKEKKIKKSTENKVTQSDENNCPFVDEYIQCADDSLSKDITDGDYDESSPKTVTKNDDDAICSDTNFDDNSIENESIVDNLKSKKDTPLYEYPNEPQVCSVCNLKCPNVHDLIKHRSKNHAPKKFQCLVCGNGLTTTRGLRFHMRLHTGEKPEVCVICGKAFSDPRTLKSHGRIHTGQQPFPCPMCDKRFPARLSLSLHLRSHTGERPYQCPQCDKSYVQANSLQIHMRTHTGIRPYPCKMCNKAFTNSTSLSVHMLTHSGVKNFQCTICGKRMARSGELTIHLRTHSGERPFTCNICHKSFTNSSALRAHTPTHTGVKNFVCSVCGKRVARAVELRVHMRTHTGERRYRCSYCDQSFSTNSNMRLHQRKHTGEKPYACEMCGRRFADSHVLKNHIRTHTGEKPFTCETCGHAFAQHASLRTHLNTHHKALKTDSFSETKMWDSAKESQSFSQIIPIDTKPSEFINNMNVENFSKMLSPPVINRNGEINLQECLPIVIADNADHQEISLGAFQHPLTDTLPLMNMISRDNDVYIPTCSSATIP